MHAVVLLYPHAHNEAALHVAQNLCETLTAVGVGTDQPSTLATAAAYGATKFIHIPPYTEQAAFDRLPDVQLVIAPAVPAIRAQHPTGWAYVEGVQQITGQLAAGLTVIQTAPGEQRQFACPVPVSLTVRPHITSVPFVPPGQPSDIETWALSGEPPQPMPPPTRIDTDQPDEAANQLFNALRGRGLLEILAPRYGGVQLLATEPDDTPLPLTSAAVIVAGGKGMAYTSATPPPKAPNPFAWRVANSFESILRPLADALGGTLAASRAVVDAAGINTTYLVGQSGQQVAPRLYLAAGISGQPQHLGAIQGTETLVAVNPDAAAPILAAADIGVVGDAAAILSRLTALIVAARSNAVLTPNNTG